MAKGFTLNQAVLKGSLLCYAYRYDQETGMLVETLRDQRELPRSPHSPFLSEARQAIIRRLRALRNSWSWRLPFAPRVSARAAATWREIAHLQNILLAMEEANEADALSLAPFVEPHPSREFVAGTFLPVGASIWVLSLPSEGTPTMIEHTLTNYRPTDFTIIDYEIRSPGRKGENDEFDRLTFPSDAIHDDGTIALPSRAGRVELFWKRAPAQARLAEALDRAKDLDPA